MQLPSSKVGITLTLVVLVVAGTIFSTKITKKEEPIIDLENVDLLIERKTSGDLKSGDNDTDGLPDWLEEFYRTDSNNPDTDGDGTPDGEEIELDRDPSIAGPNDPLITRKDLINTETDLSDFTPGTITDKVSVELFSEYLILKKQGVLQPEDEAQLVENLSKKVTEQASLKPKYSQSDLNIVPPTNETITAYGDRLAQVSLESLTQLDSRKKLIDSEYLLAISKDYKLYADNLLQISVPTVSQEVHLELINYLYRTGVLFETMVNTDADPLSALVIISQYKTITVNDTQLYTALAQYFKNNDILFDTESTIRFWRNFEN